jgi:hypothetical protein
MNRRLVRLICLAVGVGLLGYTVSGLIRNHVFLLGAAQADGVVVDLRQGHGGDSLPVIRFPAQDGSVVDWVSQGQGAASAYHVGDHLHVLYMPETPSIAVIGSYLGIYGRFLIAAFIGLVLVSIGRRALTGPRSMPARRR